MTDEIDTLTRSTGIMIRVTDEVLRDCSPMLVQGLIADSFDRSKYGRPWLYPDPVRWRTRVTDVIDTARYGLPDDTE
jgi:hypothetical protein